MDYWQHLDGTRYRNFQEFQEMHPGAKIWMATTKAHQTYTDVKFGSDDYIMFGKESAGIPEEILVELCIRDRLWIIREYLVVLHMMTEQISRTAYRQ